MHMPKTTLILALAIALTSCVAPPSEINSIADMARITGDLPRNRATVFVHLPSSIQTVKGKVTVDEKIFARLSTGSFTKLTLSPGIHTIDIKFPALTGPNSEEYTFNFQKDTVYHLILIDGPKNPNLGTALVDGLIYSAAHLRPMNVFDGLELSRYEQYIASSQEE
jgi:hypothetical protein